MADEFSEEIICEILSRLPVKSLARFRCVSKLWSEYINDPYLQTIHALKEEPMPLMFQEIIHPKKKRSNKQQCKISFLRVIQGTSAVKKDPVLKFRCKMYSSVEKMVGGSCNGLTLVAYEKDEDDSNCFLALINPLSKRRYDLPPLEIIKFAYNFGRFAGIGIGFDDSTNTLKTVCVVLKEPAVTCSTWDINVAREQLCTMVHYPGTSSWREVPQVPAYPITGAGVFAHGRLHWLVSSQWWSLDHGRKIVWFDVKTEEFGLTDPPERKGGYWTNDQLVDLNGEVGIAYIEDCCIELWTLRQEERVLHCRFYLYDLYPLLCNDVVEISGCWNKDGDILLTSNRGRRLFVYTIKTGNLRRLADLDDRCHADIRMYRTSLFSIGKSVGDQYSTTQK